MKAKLEPIYLPPEDFDKTCYQPGTWHVTIRLSEGNPMSTAAHTLRSDAMAEAKEVCRSRNIELAAEKARVA